MLEDFWNNFEISVIQYGIGTNGKVQEFNGIDNVTFFKFFALLPYKFCHIQS